MRPECHEATSQTWSRNVTQRELCFVKPRWWEVNSPISPSGQLCTGSAPTHGHGVGVGAVPVPRLLRGAQVMTREVLARPRALAPTIVWTDSACRQSWGESRILAIQAPVLGSDASTLLSREPTFLPGPSPAPRLLLPSASYLSLQCLESVILSGLGCEQLWGQGEACCEVMGFPWGLVSELKACQSWRGHPSSAPAARFPLPGPRQPTSTSLWGGRDS